MRAEPARLVRSAARVAAVFVLANVLALVALWLCGGTASGSSLVREKRDSVQANELGRAEWDAALDLQKRLADLTVVHDEHGRSLLQLDTARGTLRLAPEDFVEHLEQVQADQRAHGPLFVLFNVTTPIGFVWVGLGFLGQALFMLRMVLQWYASEREHRSVVPVGFWWGSLFGGLMLLVYFVWRRDIVGVLGQSTGVFVYARNLVLIYRPRPATARSSAVPTPQA